MAHNILVVDDSLLARCFMEKALNLSGLDVEEIFLAVNGVDALEQLKNKWVDIVFADINMPEMSGIELVHAMAKEPTLKSIPVVIVSTERSEARMDELKHEGIRDYITKPFTPERLKQVVTEIFS